MSSVPYETNPGWSWPEEPFEESSNEGGIPTPRTPSDDDMGSPADAPRPNSDETNTPPRTERHYPPRTCRICLETVMPTYEPAPEGIASMLNPVPKVSYISSDPEAGRLIRPCKCSGSSRYVHEGCLDAWRHADPRYQRRNFLECPTCGFRYRLERMRWARWISSTFLQLLLTLVIMLTAIFVFGFVADPIIDICLDPLDTITSLPSGGRTPIRFEDDFDASWAIHFLKGMASIGMLGFVKIFFASPRHLWNLRQTRLLGTGGRRAGTGRDRLEDISWTFVFVGLITFLIAVWKWVRVWSRRTLEKASERVADVQGDDDDFEEAPHANDPPTTTPANPENGTQET